MLRHPSPSYSITIRAEIDNRVGMFARIATAISEAGGDLGSVDIVRIEKGKIIRDITVNARNEAHEKQIVNAIKKISGVNVVRVFDRTFSAHIGGKIEIHNKYPVRDRNDLSKVYTPGVARVCNDIYLHREHAYRYTIKGNSVAIVSDGTAVLGLGNIGPEAALPVMEGKAMIFKEFASIDAFPVVMYSKDPYDIVKAVESMSATFGGINLEDIKAPECFYIERQLRERLDIPVIHDDQHGTAVVVLAALINVGRLYRKDIRKFRVLISGAGAAGTATARLLYSYGLKDIVVCDSAGAIYRGRRKNMNKYKKELAAITNPEEFKGTIHQVIQGRDVFIGLSRPDILRVDDIKGMSKNPVIFALANPDPEISPEDALPYARVIATGRSDYPNQINNMLSFPGIFRGLLDVRAKGINDEVKIAAAKAIAYSVDKAQLHEDYIIPSIFNKKVTANVAHAVSETAKKTGLARK